MEKHRFRTGDQVLHRPTGETWVLAYADYETGYLAACGWPDSEARIVDCDLVTAVDDDMHGNLLAELSVSGDRRGGKANQIARGMHAAA